jgi:magnesium transporter
MAKDEASGPRRRGPIPEVLVGSVRRVLPRQFSGHRAPPSTLGGIVDWALYDKGNRVDCKSIEAAYEIARKSREAFVWIGLYQPSDEEFAHIASQLALHPLAVEDAIHAHQRPKVEEYGESLFMVLKPARYVDRNEVIKTGDIMMFVSPDFVVSVRHGDATALSDVRHELESRPDVMTAGPSAVLWAVADRIVDEYVDAIDGVARDIEEIEAAVFDAKADAPTERIYKLKREILEFRRAIDPLSEALATLADGKFSLIDARTMPYFRDVQDHAIRDAGRLDAYDETLSDVMQANVAQVSLRQNEDMRRITAWAAILAVITSFAGIYGMNFQYMPELRWHYGYFMCLGAMLISSVIMYASFKRRHWL